MQRIEAYLAEEEIPAWASSLKAAENPGHFPESDSRRVGFEGATFEWHRRAENAATPATSGAATLHGFQLTNLDISFPTGKLTLVSGRTGSGKTALLNALLGGTPEYLNGSSIPLRPSCCMI
jgi:ABC-type transport system involved in cytochrome bd biosynthesis fused ATPase/permease subunit